MVLRMTNSVLVFQLAAKLQLSEFMLMILRTNADQRLIYIFVRNATIWTQQAKIINPEGAANARFGLKCNKLAEINSYRFSI